MDKQITFKWKLINQEQEEGILNSIFLSIKQCRDYLRKEEELPDESNTLHFFPFIMRTRLIGEDLSGNASGRNIQQLVEEEEDLRLLLHDIQSEFRCYLQPFRPSYLRKESESQLVRKMHDLVVRVEQRHPAYNYYPLTEERIISMTKKENIKVVSMEGLPCFAAICVAASPERKEAYLFVRPRKSIHQAQWSFFVLHELGHWFMHVRPFLDEIGYEPSRRIVPLKVDTNWIDYEFQADIFALIGLMPTNHLLYLKNRGQLTTEETFKVVAKWYGWFEEQPSDDLAAKVKENILLRIVNFNKFYKLYLEHIVHVIRQDNLLRSDVFYFTNRLFSRHPWVRLNKKHIVVDVSSVYAELLGLPREKILNKSILDLVHDESRAETEFFLKQREQLKGVCQYYIRHKYPSDKISVSLVQAWRVSEDTMGEFSTLAFVTPRGYVGDFGWIESLSVDKMISDDIFIRDFRYVYNIENMKDNSEGINMSGEWEELVEWFHKNKSTLLQEYNEEYVVICDGAVVDHDRDKHALQERLYEGKYKDKVFFFTKVSEIETVEDI